MTATPIEQLPDEVRYSIPTMGREPVTAEEVQEELADLRRYYLSEKEWPHHRQQARDRESKILAELLLAKEQR